MPCTLTAWRPLGGLLVALFLLCFAAPLNVLAAAEDKKGPKVPDWRRFLVDEVPAFHWRTTHFVNSDLPITAARREPQPPPPIDRVEEGWVVRDRGCRFEVRRESKLTLVIVQTPRWRFQWDVAANVVTADPGNPSCRMRGMQPGLAFTFRDECLKFAEKAKATWVSEKERRDGREVEKITFWYLADPLAGFRSPIHGFIPELHQKLLDSPKAEFRMRTEWFDPKTGRRVGHRCGCKGSAYEELTDFPAPESLPRELFTFQIPRDAVLEVRDPELGRVIHSQGQKKPDLRQ